MERLLRLILLRPFERFVPQWLSVSTSPHKFFYERIRLDDTSNLVRAANFFLTSVSAAFLIEIGTLYLLRLGDIGEPFYWLFIIVTSLPFVLLCYVLVNAVTTLSPRAILHLSLYPMGAGILTGATLTFVAASVVAVLVAGGYIPDPRYDYSAAETGVALEHSVLRDCLKEASLVYRILATGLQEPYTNLRPPIDALSYVRPIVALLYLPVVGILVMLAAGARRRAAFSLVLIAAVLSTGLTAILLKRYFEWNFSQSGCEERLLDLAAEKRSEPLSKKMAADFEKVIRSGPLARLWDVSVFSEGRQIHFVFKLRRPIVNREMIGRGLELMQQEAMENYCDSGVEYFRRAKITQTHAFYDVDGARLTSFALSPKDCAH